MKKGKFAKRTILFFILQVFLFCFNLFCGEMIKPRIIYQLKTEYFDILYSKESTYTARLLADNADSIFKNAHEILNVQTPINRIPVVISPDSDVFSVSYSAYPYNRIVVMEGVPSSHNTYETELFEKFYSQVLKATAASIKSPFNKALSNFITCWQPVEVLNLPYSALEGVSFVDQILTGSGKYNDGYFLQILSQAKLEGKFPTWFQSSARSNAWTSDELNTAANAAFAAYLIQEFGIEKYSDFLNECGKLKIGKLTRGIFKDIYELELTDVWKAFEDSVPVPQDLIALEGDSNLFFKGNNGTYEQMINTPYGFVFFDSVKNEVVLAKKKTELEKIFSGTQIEYSKFHLFYAKNITKFDLSPDGRYLLVCCNEEKWRSNFKESRVRFYDLKYKVHLHGHFNMRDAAFVTSDDSEKLFVAGISTEKKHSVLEVYDFKQRWRPHFKQETLFSRSFEHSVNPKNLSYAGNDSLLCLLFDAEKKNYSFLKIDSLIKGEVSENEFSFFSDEAPAGFNLRNLRFQHFSSSPSNEAQNFYTFEFIEPHSNSFTRTGILLCSDSFEPQQILLQKKDVSGGVYSPFFNEDRIYFMRKMLDSDRIDFLPLDDFFYEEKNLSVRQNPSDCKNFDCSIIPTRESLKADFPHSLYFPFAYASKGSMYTFFPIASFDYEEDVVLWPGLGLTYATSSDPFGNSTVLSSASFGFSQYKYLKLDENFIEEIDRIIQNFKNFQNDFTFSALIKNTSTPVDLKLGSLYSFGADGHYTWKSIAGGNWKFPFLYNMNSLQFSLQFQYIASSIYTGTSTAAVHPDLTDWPAFSNIYHFTELFASAHYTNVHQDGTSLFERYGLSAKVITVTDWDYFASVEKATKFTVGTSISYDIPRLLPLANYNGFVFCLPTKLSYEMFVTDGTALKSEIETLLIGKEVRNGIFPVFVSRTGLKFGYSYSLEYKAEDNLPDVRNFDEYMSFLTGSTVVESFYLKYVLDIVPVVGTLSNQNLRGVAKFAFLPHTQEFKLSIGVYIDFE